MQCYLHEIFLSIFVFLPYVICKIDPIDYPTELARCYNEYHKKTSLSKSVGYQVHFKCYQDYRFKTSKERQYKGKYFGLKNNAYISSLREDVTTHTIKKRQAKGKGKGKPKKRMRKEFRMLTDKERDRYLNAINTLKTTYEMVDGENMSRFDLLAAFHNGDQVGAHGGCGFAPWHRAYLIMYEQALMQVDRKVTLPYWDSTLDYYMEDSTQSILWSGLFAGNGDGLVNEGAFANWNTSVGPLMRNIGVAGKLYSEEDITNVTTQTQYGQICGEEAPPETDLEFLHGPIHVYVDGNMGIIETAATEPLFFMHHAFVDLIWEEFRKNQRRNGVDPAEDYPPEFFGDIFHHPDEPMGIGTMTMRQGLGNRFVEDIFDYEPRPTCSHRRQDCGSKFLKCVDVLGRFRCVSKTLAEYETDETGGGCPTVSPPTTTQSPPTTPKPPTTKPPKDRPYLHKPLQNNFCANGKSDTREWVYLPIRVTYQRPPDRKRYESFPILNGNPRRSSDIYAPSANEYKTFNKYVTPDIPNDYGNCKTSISGAGEMYIQSDGLNYDGTYREYAIVDHRLAMSMSVAYVAVKAPSNNQPSDVIISAFDSCGRVCHPTCLIPGTNYYRPCSGAIRVSEDTRVPRMYGQNFGHSVLNVWDFNSKGSTSCPQFNVDQIYVSFFCDYTARWPWEHARKQNIPPPPPKTRRPSLDRPAGPNENPNLGQEVAPPLTKPQKQKCDIQGCIIEREDCSAACENLVNYPCVNQCNRFARCFYNKYYLQRCHWGHFDRTLNKCSRGKGHCTDDEYRNGKTAKFSGFSG